MLNFPLRVEIHGQVAAWEFALIVYSYKNTWGLHVPVQTAAAFFNDKS